jgi:hypothetical protein
MEYWDYSCSIWLKNNTVPAFALRASVYANSFAEKRLASLFELRRDMTSRHAGFWPALVRRDVSVKLFSNFMELGSITTS